MKKIELETPKSIKAESLFDTIKKLYIISKSLESGDLQCTCAAVDIDLELVILKELYKVINQATPIFDKEVHNAQLSLLEDVSKLTNSQENPTLRDHFAMSAMNRKDMWAFDAYAIADDMLRERNNKIK